MDRPRKVLGAGLLVMALLTSGCGSSGDGDAERTPVEKAQDQVDRATSAVDDAQTAFDDSSQAFCGDAADLIGVVDQYGRILHKEQVTVGDLRSGAEDVSAARDDAGGSADQAVADHGTLIEAQAALAEAMVGLDVAEAAAAGETTTTTAAATTTTAAPLVPKETTDRVASAEEALRTTAEGVTDDTPVVDAGLRLGSAAFAVEVAWLRLLADAGCLTSEQQGQAVAAVAEYTTALQQDLTAAGLYSGPIDGVYGPSTVAAVEALQTQANLPVTGLVDPATDRALGAAVAQVAGGVAVGITTRTAAIQGGLKALGYWDGPTDGQTSAALTAAIVQLQTDLGIEPTGVVDPATLDAIASTVDQAKSDAATTTTVTTTTPAEPATTTTTAPPG